MCAKCFLFVFFAVESCPHHGMALQLYKLSIYVATSCGLAKSSKFSALVGYLYVFTCIFNTYSV